jgi:hypothetical protein
MACKKATAKQMNRLVALSGFCVGGASDEKQWIYGYFILGGQATHLSVKYSPERGGILPHRYLAPFRRGFLFCRRRDCGARPESRVCFGGFRRTAAEEALARLGSVLRNEAKLTCSPVPVRSENSIPRRATLDVIG